MSSHSSCPSGSLRDYPRDYPSSSPNSSLSSPKGSPTCLSSYLIYHSSSPLRRHSCQVYPRNYPACRSRPLPCHNVPSSTTQTWPTASTALSPSRMPKQQQQQQTRDMELDSLVRQSPLLQPRTPSPSSPTSALELPNIPSYHRLPPIALPRQLSGLSNPGFHIEDDLPSARRSGGFSLLQLLSHLHLVENVL